MKISRQKVYQTNYNMYTNNINLSKNEKLRSGYVSENLPVHKTSDLEIINVQLAASNEYFLTQLSFVQVPQVPL